MRILFVTQVVLDRPHGGPRHVLAVARAWGAAGHAVRLLAPGDEPASPGLERIRPPGGARPGARLEARQAVSTAREVRRSRPDVAYVRLSATSSLVPATLAALRVPFVTELNGRLLDELRLLGRPEPAVRAVQLVERAIARGAFATVAVEAKIGRHARDALGARDVRVVENGADLSVATPGDRAAARRRLDLPEDRPVLAFAGTLAPELRLDLLLDAIGRLPGAPLLVVMGDGPQAARLEGAPSERVRWLGPRPHAEAIDLLRAADVCVNVRDGDLGMKALEYAAVGRRFVAFRVEGGERLEGLYPGHRAAFLVDARSADALARALEDALREEARAPLPPAAVEAARAEVGWERTARRIAAILDEAATRGARGRGRDDRGAAS
jgi:glycosyltransferase involved in cell wall biosynthesis